MRASPPSATSQHRSRRCQLFPLNVMRKPYGRFVNRSSNIVVVAVLAVVQCLGHSSGVFAGANGASSDASLAAKSQETGKTQTAIEQVTNEALPAPVQEMRDAILAAVASGEIEELRSVLEWNELRPELGIARETDAIAGFKSASADGEGLQILAILGEILETAPAKLPIGRDFENNGVYVWPYLAELKTDLLTPSQKIELYRLVPPLVAKEIVKSGTWSWYRIAIGADGTWHVFAKDLERTDR